MLWTGNSLVTVCALSFIYESHYLCNAEQNSSDVTTFISFIVFIEWYYPSKTFI